MENLTQKIEDLAREVAPIMGYEYVVTAKDTIISAVNGFRKNETDCQEIEKSILHIAKIN